MHKTNKKKKVIALFIVSLILLIPVAFAQDAAPVDPPETVDALETLNPLEPTLPFINVNIPEYSTTTELTIEGTTTPHSIVKLYIDNSPNPTAQQTRDFTGEDGIINFLDIFIGHTGTTHTIKIETTDLDNNINQEEFSIIIDIIPPNLQLTQIPDLISEQELTIEGTVDEESTINIFLFEGEEDTTAPAKTEGLTLDKAEKNLIQFSWTEAQEEDFANYIIYRDDIGAIALIDQKAYLTFSDPNVNSNQEYTYQVATMDTAGNIGIKSTALTATTLEEGITDLTLPEPIDLSSPFTPLKTTLTNDTINETITFDIDATYRLKVEAVDKAGNIAEFTKTILVDAIPPEISITSPQPGIFMYEHYADEVDITGRTEPNANVYLYIERTPFGLMDTEFTLAGIPDEIQNFRDPELRADCKLKAIGVGSCRSNADYDIKADEAGNFKIKNVDMTGVGISLGITPVDASDLDLSREDKESRTARLLFVAEDIAGQKGTTLAQYNIGTCWSGNFTWEVTPLTKFQSPTFLSTERLAEGTETLYFIYNFSYVGQANSAEISRVSISKVCDSNIKRQSRFNQSCDIMRSCSGRPLPGTDRTWYFACPLSQSEGMDTWLKDDWSNFYESLSNEMSFPYRIRITFRETNDQGKSGTAYQTSCDEVTYVLDNSRIDFSKLPDFLLYDTVSFLQTASETLETAMEKVNKVLEWVGLGCIASYGIKFVLTIVRRITCSGAKLTQILSVATPDTPQKQACRECLGDQNPALVPIDDLPNQCLEVCAPGCAKAWKAEETFYKAYRGLCDRVFCHKTPAKWTQDKDDKELVDAQRQQSNKCNAVDSGFLGQVIRKTKCKSLQKRYQPFMEFRVDPFEECFEVSLSEGDKIPSYVYKFSDGQKSVLNNKGIYELEMNENRPDKGKIFAIKQNDKTYLTKRALSCEQVCNQEGYKGAKNTIEVKLRAVNGGAETTRVIENPYASVSTLENAGIFRKESDENPITTVTIRSALENGKYFKEGETLYEIEERTVVPIISQSETTQQKSAYCTTVKDCNAINKVEEKKEGEDYTYPPIFQSSLDKEREYKSEIYGFTSDCFPTHTTPKQEVIKELGKGKEEERDLRKECCCVSESDIITGRYYTKDDEKTIGKIKIPLFEEDEITDNDFPKFDYRYHRTKYESDQGHYTYNPDRYVEGRDRMGCFGQNVFLRTPDDDGTGGKLIHDPFKSHTSAFQCLCVSGIYNRINMLRNMVEAMKTCLIEVRETGTADAGVCKEIFSQYVCSLTWRFIDWTRTGCIGGEQGVSLDESDNKIAQAFSRGMDGVFGAVGEAGEELGQEYGNTQINSFFEMGEEGVARKICLGAFGYDLDLDWRDVLDVAYATPMATLVIAPTRSREYLTFDPINGYSSYEYRSSWMVNPGCEMDNYDVNLACISRDELDKPGVRCDQSNECDCLNQDDEILRTFYNGRALTNGILEDKDQHEVVTSSYRYDHLKFTLQPDRSIRQNLREDCFPEGHEDGVFYFPINDRSQTDLADWFIDPTTGTFRLNSGSLLWGQEGNAYFIDNTLYKDRESQVPFEPTAIELNEGEDLHIEPEIWKGEGPDVCLRIAFPNEAGIEQEQFMEVTIEGPFRYPRQLIAKNINAISNIVIPPDLGATVMAPFLPEEEENFILTFYDKDQNKDDDFKGRINLCNSDSNDEVEFDGKKEEITEHCNDENELIIGSRSGLKLKINQVKPLTTTGTNHETFVSFTIRRESGPSSEDIKNLRLSLVKLKGDKQIFENENDCNAADIIKYNNKLQTESFSIPVKVGTS